MPETSEFDRKLQAALNEQEATGMWRANYDPHVDRGLRKLGLRVRPPHCRSFLATMLGFGALFAIGMAIISALSGSIGARDITSAGLNALAVGLIFGGSMALSYHLDRRKHRLRDWDDL